MTGVVLVSSTAGCRGRRGEEEEGRQAKEEERRKQQQISVLALLLAAIRRSMASSCRMEREGEDEVIPSLQQMEIGWPTNVRHVAHVTFDRFNGFLGLPVEFELEVPGRVPSARSAFSSLTPYLNVRTKIKFPFCSRDFLEKNRVITFTISSLQGIETFVIN